METPGTEDAAAGSGQAVEDELVRALLDASLYPHPVERFSVIETHISWVILTGEYAYKIKKPVNLGFLDFSTLASRAYYCKEELRLNRRFAPELYLEVIDITGSRTQPRLQGEGKAVEYAVKMREFPQHCLLTTCASEQRLQPEHIDSMAAVVAGFHSRAQPAEADTGFGSCDTFLKWNRENFRHIEAALPGDLLPAGFEALKTWCLAPDEAQQRVIDSRRVDGCVRECHGDLHLGNMALIDNHITLFDCIEFNPELRWIDTMSEAAFLAMDLQAHGYPGFSWRFLNRYLQASGDYPGLAVLRHYLVYRALVRAKVEALRAHQQHATADAASTYREAATYAGLAMDWWKNARPALIIMHGFSGSGKSTHAGHLVEALGAVQIRSDVERKRLFALQPDAASGSAVAGGIYTAAASERTYQRLADLARIILHAGYTAIVDASFLERSQREYFRALARQCDAPSVLLTCGAAEHVLRERIRHRRAHENDPSEATLAVLQHQLHSHDPLTPEEQADALATDPARPVPGPALLEELSARIAPRSRP